MIRLKWSKKTGNLRDFHGKMPISGTEVTNRGPLRFSHSGGHMRKHGENAKAKVEMGKSRRFMSVKDFL